MIVLSPHTASTLSPLTASQSWVMFVQIAPPIGGGGPIKIEGVRGEMIAPRLLTISAENAYEAFVIGLLPVEGSPEDVAHSLYEQFSAAHKHDGWFEPTIELLTFIHETSQQALQALIDQTRPGGSPDGAVDIDTMAEIIGVSVPTVRRLVSAKQIPSFRVGRQLRFVVIDVLEALKRR